MGHWVCLTRKKDIYIFFDSYGYNPFHNLNFISKKMNELLGQEKTDFSGLFKGLKKGSYTLDYSKYLWEMVYCVLIKIYTRLFIKRISIMDG